MFSNLKIGITSRVTRAESYNELRDSLAADWAIFISRILPHACWIALPNLGEATVAYAQGWSVNALILTGGNDIGEYPHKDATDLALLGDALARNTPVFAVCRGLQVMQHAFGGTLTKVDAATHVATQHAVNFMPLQGVELAQTVQVNSYHRYGITTLADGLEAFAAAEDGTIEAARITGKHALGVMWHPERNAEIAAHDAALIRHIFQSE
jgi:gamma-glutamyl-gamma-aminobutyrate hydrolase PuuD